MDKREKRPAPRDTQNQPQFFWNTRSNSVELLNHWIACRGHRFGYAEVSE